MKDVDALFAEDVRADDDTRDAARALNVVLVRVERVLQTGIRDLLVVLERIAANTEGLPALVEGLKAHSNGGQSIGGSANMSASEE